MRIDNLASDFEVTDIKRALGTCLITTDMACKHLKNAIKAIIECKHRYGNFKSTPLEFVLTHFGRTAVAFRDYIRSRCASASQTSDLETLLKIYTETKEALTNLRNAPMYEPSYKKVDDEYKRFSNMRSDIQKERMKYKYIATELSHFKKCIPPL